MTQKQSHASSRRISKSHVARFHARRASKNCEWLPDDYEVNRDFYVSGAPKKEPRKGRWLPNRGNLRRPTAQQVNKFNKMMSEIAVKMKDIPPSLTSECRYHRRGHAK